MITVEDFADALRMDLHDYLTELRIDADPVRMFKQDLKAVRKQSRYSKDEVQEVKEYFLDYIDSLFMTQAETIQNSPRDKELEYTPTPSDYFKDKGSVTTLFFTESATIPSREVYNRSTPGEKTVQFLITEIGYFDLALTEKVHSQWLQVSPLTIKGRPVLRVGMLMVDLECGSVKCNVYRCKAEFQLSHKVDDDGNWDREWAEYQVLRMFAHLGTHDHPKNPWPKFKVLPSPFRDSDDQRLANRSLTISRQYAARK